MKIVIELSDETYKDIKEENGIYGINDGLSARITGKVVGAIQNGTPLPKCNECKYYEGVRKVQGHAPCSYHTIGGVMWDWYCSQFEADKGSDSE